MLNSTSSSSASRQQVLQVLLAEKARRRVRVQSRFTPYQQDPAGFVEQELLGFLWSKQRDICESVVKHRFTAVKSCHDVGKTAVAARIGAWWLSVWPPGEAFLVSSAPTRDQVRALLWREINNVHRAGGLPGRTNQTEWIFPPNEIVGFGRSVRDTDPTAFQGIHARRVLVIFDEACGISSAIWDAAETLVANDDSRFLAIGNPDDPASEFARCCKPGTNYNVISISVFDSPNFTDEVVPDWLRPLLVGRTWVEERRKKWGETSPLWVSKVTGDFPEQSKDGLIPLTALRQAVDRELEPVGPNELGVDVARHGSAWTVIYSRKGPVARLVERFQNRDLMYTSGRVVHALRETGATAVKVDDAGLGGGVTDRLLELRSQGDISAIVAPINVGTAPHTKDGAERFVNLRAEINWAMRERFVEGRIDLGDDEDLLAQAGDVKYEQDSKGHIKIEAKEKAAKRGQPSPDDWDALVLAFAPPEFGRKMVFATQEPELTEAPFDIPRQWSRAFAVDITRGRASVIWAAFDPTSDVVHLYGEYEAPSGDMVVPSAAIRDRGHWVPGVFQTKTGERGKEEGDALAGRMLELHLDLYAVEDSDAEAGVADIQTRIAGKRLRVFSNLTGWLGQYRTYRRDRKGDVVDENDGLMRATGLLCLSGRYVASPHPAVIEEASEEWADAGRDSVTGY